MNVLIRFDFIYRPPLCTMRFNEMKLFLFDLNSDSSAFSALLFLKTELKYWVVLVTVLRTFTISKNVRERPG